MYKHILMPTDGSACSGGAIRQGLELARALGAEVTFLYALDDPVLYTPELASYGPEMFEDMKGAATEALARAQELAQKVGVTAKTRLIEHKTPVTAIHEAERDADLVVMGTHGRRGFDRVVFGSVAEGALRHQTLSDDSQH